MLVLAQIVQCCSHVICTFGSVFCAVTDIRLTTTTFYHAREAGLCVFFPRIYQAMTPLLCHRVAASYQAE